MNSLLQYYFLFFTITLVISIFLFNNFKKVAFKINLIDKPSTENVHLNSVPTGSGIIFLFLFYFSVTIFFLYDEFFFNQLPKNYIVLFLSILILSLVSFFDDLKSIHPFFRLFVQLTLTMFCTSSLYLSNFFLPLKLTIFLCIYFWVYLINIINFTDGSDGFLATNSIFFFLVIIILQLQTEISISFYFSLFILPALIGYIFFNKPSAKIFMGDTGSVFIGFIVGYISLENIIDGNYNIIISILAYPFLDCTTTLIKKVYDGYYPWARRFDYFFLRPLKNKKEHLKVFMPNMVYNLINFLIVIIQIFYDIELLCILSIIMSFGLMYYYRNN